VKRIQLIVACLGTALMIQCAKPVEGLGPGYRGDEALRTQRRVAASLRATVEGLLATKRFIFLHPDLLGSSTLSTGPVGVLKGRRWFGPSGDGGLGKGDHSPYGFSGQEWDESVKEWHFKHRGLDPQSGRWASPDPLFRVVKTRHFSEAVTEVSGAYAYVGNNPSTNLDPNGLLLKRPSGGKGLGKKVTTASKRWKRAGRKLMKRKRREFKAMSKTKKAVVIAGLAGAVLTGGAAVGVAAGAGGAFAGAAGVLGTGLSSASSIVDGHQTLKDGGSFGEATLKVMGGTANALTGGGVESAKLISSSVSLVSGGLTAKKVGAAVAEKLDLNPAQLLKKNEPPTPSVVVGL